MSRLPDRASHVFFLRRLAAEKQPGKGSGTLGDLLTAQVVKEYVRPATMGTKTNFVDCLRAGSLDKMVAVGLGWCPNGVLTEEPANPKAFGPTTYFASHAWSYRFKEFVSMLEGHYNSQPKTQGGTSYVPIYYWVDILAVTQHFSGDFKDHPDSDFPGVIRASQAVLFTMHPWRSPVAPTRVWCLFEALTAVQAKGVGFEVILDTGNSKDTNASTLLAIASGIDARAANATVASDKAYIMGCIKAGLGVDAFNTVLRDTLKAALAEVMMTKAMNENNNAAAIALVKVGACTGQNGVLDLPRYLPHASPAEVASVLDALAGSGGGGAAPTPRGLVLAARTRGMQLTSRSSTWEDGAGKALGEMPHHRGPCPGSSRSTAAYDPNKGDRPVWTYMPPRGGVLAALGRLLAARQQPAAAAAARSGGGGGGSGGDAASSTAGGGGLMELWLSLGPPDANDEEVAGGGATHKTESGANASPAAAGSGSRTSLPRLPPASVRQLRGSGGAASASAPSSPMRGAAAAAGGSRATAAASGGAAGRGVVAGGGGGGTGGGGGRVALWSGLRASGTLRMLCLHGCVLCPADVDGLAAALRGNSVLRVLQVWDFIPPPAGSATGAAGAGGLIGGLLAAGLASRTLTHLCIVPSRVCWVPELPELPAAAGAAGSALKELVLAPVALAPPAMRQLAEALEALPGLCGGAVDCLKPPPLTWLPAPTPEEFGQWWEVRTPVPKGSTYPPNHIQVMQVVEERRCSPSGVPMEAGAPAEAVGELRALFEVIGVGGSSCVSSGGGSALSRGGGSAEAFLPPLLQRASNSSSAAAFTTTPGGGASSTGYTDADAAAGPWAPRTAAVAHFIGACAGLPAAQARGVTHSTSHTGGLYTVPVEEGLAAAAASRNYDAIMTAALKAAPPEYVSRIKRHELLPQRKDGFLLAKALHASQWD